MSAPGHYHWVVGYGIKALFAGVGVGFSVVGLLQPADPQLIGPYQLVGRLGSGGMGRVFLGMSAAGRPVAVKIIHAGLAADPEFRARFNVEVAAARRVSGLFTALVVDADVDAPVPWLATAYVAGPSLAEAVKDRGPLSPAFLLALTAGLAKGLSAIHAAGVVHGDLKPSNVLLALDGPRVIDFGISQAAEAAPLTHWGLVVGTPSFMSPEQATGRNVGPLSDVFSLGAVLAFAATGRKPFGTGSPAAVLERVVHGPPKLDDAPTEVRPLIERCLAKDPGQRPTAPELLAEVSAVQAAMESLAEQTLDSIIVHIPLGGVDDQPLDRPQAATGPDRRRWRPRVTAAAITGILAASGAAGYDLTAAAGPQPGTSSLSQAAAQMAAPWSEPSRAAAPSRPSPPPRITRTFTYQQGAMVFFEIYYSDPGGNAEGFGFVGVDESDWPEQNHPFSNPANGIVEAGSVAYPLNQGCGTGLEYTSSVRAWIYDATGARSQPVVIHLACTT
jgi:eukaryotic-like serine/threonine-protein kinase